MDELIQILVQFGGGKGGEPNNVAVRFLLPTFFWSVLAWISLRECRNERLSKDCFVGIAALIGMSRELLMFIAEYGGWRGFVPFSFLYTYYPPLEHAFTMLSCVFIGYAFLNYHLHWKVYPRRFIQASATITVILYMVIAVAWPSFLRQHPGISFGQFWGDLVFRTAAVIFMGMVLGPFVHAAAMGTKISTALLCGFSMLFLDEFLMIFNILSNERHVEIFAPIRHNLHIWAIPFLLGMYWNDLRKRMVATKQSLQSLNAELEHRVEQRTTQLIEANDELETFNYSVSHDLRSPLRHIEGYASMLMEECADQFSDVQKTYLQRISRASGRMNAMIEALLKLSRSSRSGLQIRQIDLSRMAREIAAELPLSEPDRRVTFQIHDGVTVWGDLQLIRLVMENLLGNAWKYSAKQPEAFIVFGTMTHGEETVYFVRDNGAGFDMTYADKLFAPFQRLHSEEEFTGIGIGLATVQRILRRHGGRVWAESQVNQGATIYFTLPNDSPPTLT